MCLPSGSSMRLALGGCISTIFTGVTELSSLVFKPIAAHGFTMTINKVYLSYTTKEKRTEIRLNAQLGHSSSHFSKVVCFVRTLISNSGKTL